MTTILILMRRDGSLHREEVDTDTLSPAAALLAQSIDTNINYYRASDVLVDSIDSWAELYRRAATDLKLMARTPPPPHGWDRVEEYIEQCSRVYGEMFTNKAVTICWKLSFYTESTAAEWLETEVATMKSVGADLETIRKPLKLQWIERALFGGHR